jgi:uncharacterized membrane protein
MRPASDRLIGLLFLAFALAGGAAPAEAALKLCNRTSYILYAATGTSVADGVATKGWTRIVPGACNTAVKSALGSAPLYVYARSSQAHNGPAHAWGGHDLLCAESGDFSLDTAPSTGRCPADEAFEMPFAQIENGGARDWTTSFTQAPPLKSDDAARQAGLARLLADNGMKPVTPGSKEMTAELDQFRARMKMPKDAGSDALFDALETGALKIASPAGYSVCNDTSAPVWAAIGLQNGQVWSSRGWWKVMPGGCARALTDPLSFDKVWLLVEGKGTHLLVTGKEEFCVTSIIFEVEKRGRCNDRGLVSRGFAVTNTHGLTGYTAHVSENGLLPALHAVPGAAVQSSRPK